MQRKNVARMIPLLDYVRQAGAVTKNTLLNAEDSPVYEIDPSQLRLLLQRMTDNEYLTVDKKGYYRSKN